MDDSKRQNILDNITEDVSQLLREECVMLGKRALLGNVANEPRWSGWWYQSELPASAEEYALGTAEHRGAIIRDKVPDWASMRAVFEFLREEFERDYSELLELKKEGEQ